MIIQIDQKRKDYLSSLFVIGIVLTSVFIMEITFHLLFHDATLVLSHLFYFPIIIVAILWPERGIIASTAISIVYLVLIYIMVFPDSNALITGTMQFYVYVSVGIAISMISYSTQTNEKKYRRVFTHSGSGVVLADAHTGNIIEANEQYYEITRGFRNGAEKQDKVICPDGEWPEYLDYLKKTGPVTNRETHLQVCEKNLDLLISAGMVNGKQIVVTITDITERKKAEAELKKRNQQLYVMNQVVSAANSSVNTDECLDLALRKVLKLLCFKGGVIFLSDRDGGRPEITAIVTAEEAENDLLPSLQAIDIKKPEYARAFEEGMSVFTEGRGSGFSSAAIPLVSRDKTLGVMVLADMHEHLFADEEKRFLESIGRELGNTILLNLMYSSAENARMEANFYLDVMMHDINNANTASLGYGEILYDSVGDDEKTFVSKILSSVRQSMEIIKNVRSVRDLRSVGLKPGVMSLNRAIKQAVRDKTIPLTLPDTDAEVLADNHLADVFSSLIENSRLYGGDGVSVFISVEDTGSEVIVSVEDDGRGIPEAHKEGLFRRFFSGRRNAGGKGISLSICRMIIEGYGGKIWADDRIEGKPEKGLAIRFSLIKA